MKKPFETQDLSSLREKLIGLGEQSFRKSYYPELQNSIEELERFRALLDQTNDTIFLVHISTGRLADVNQSACRQLDYSREVLLTLSLDDLVQLNGNEKLSELFFSPDSGEQNTGMITAMIMKRNGDPIPVEITLRVVTFDENIYGVAVARDITERIKYQQEREKRAWHNASQAAEAERLKTEEELQESEEKYRLLVERMNEGILVLDSQGRIIFTNSAMNKMLGYGVGELLGESLFSIISQSDMYNAVFYRNKFVHLEQLNSRQYEVPLINKEGHQIFALLSQSPLKDKDGNITGSMAVVTDITERKKIEETLRLTEERFSKAFNASSSLMCINSVDEERYIDVNDTFANITGFTKADLIGITLLESNILKQDDYIILKQEFINEGYILNVETSFFTRTGVIRQGLFSIERIKLNDMECLLITINDITEYNQMEEKLAHLNKLRLIGEMAAGIGHEIRNPMTTVRGFLQMLGSQDDSAKNKRYYDLMIEELDRANTIITEYLTLAKMKTIIKKDLNLNDILDAILPLIMANASKNDIYVEVEQNYIPNLLLDEKEIRQIILNLVSNGLEAMTPGGRLKISTYIKNQEIVLAVQNQGPEIPPDILAKLGTPFFTTKETGTGLGLAICYSIADRHNAAIKIETNPKQTTFFVVFHP